MTKTCARCGAERPVSEFHKQSAQPDGLRRWCKPCVSAYRKSKYDADPEPHRSRAREYYRSLPAAEKPSINRRANLQKYGLTLEAFDAMLVRQKGRCAVCDNTDPGGRHGQWHVDHDHRCCPGQRTCGKCVRALLCGSCNSMLGYAKDDILRLLAGAEYLRRFN